MDTASYRKLEAVKASYHQSLTLAVHTSKREGELVKVMSYIARGRKVENSQANGQMGKMAPLLRKRTHTVGQELVEVLSCHESTVDNDHLPNSIGWNRVLIGSDGYRKCT